MKTVNKKQLLLTGLLLGFVLVSFAQSKKKNILYREFSFNTSNIFQHVPILPLDGNSINAYDLLYRKRKYRKRNVNRFGITGTILVGGSTLNSFTLKWGKEWYHILLENWSYYVGYDILLYAQSTNNTGGLGVGPIAGLRYKLNERISLSTEGSMYLTTAPINGFGLALAMRPPNGIALNIRFLN